MDSTQLGNFDDPLAGCLEAILRQLAKVLSDIEEERPSEEMDAFPPLTKLEHLAAGVPSILRAANSVRAQPKQHRMGAFLTDMTGRL